MCTIVKVQTNHNFNAHHITHKENTVYYTVQAKTLFVKKIKFTCKATECVYTLSLQQLITEHASNLYYCHANYDVRKIKYKREKASNISVH